MHWLRDNVTTVVGWSLVAALSVGSHMTASEATEGGLAATKREVGAVKARVTVVERDVALLNQGFRRQEAVLERQETAQRELDRLVIELRTLVKAGRSGG